MFAYPEFNENGVKTLCEIGKLQPEMNMTIRIKRFKENETLALEDDKCETAFLLLKGEAEISWNCKTEKIKRTNPFEKTPYCLHVPKNTDVTITAKEGTEILIEQTDDKSGEKLNKSKNECRNNAQSKQHCTRTRKEI